jgi:hypothetical protein
MKRIIGYVLGVLLVLGAAQSFAQTAVWTGDYYVVIGMNEKLDYAVAYGSHLDWNDVVAGPNFEGGTFTDLTLAPTTDIPNARLPGRYEMLAVGARDGQAYAVVGYEWSEEPLFMDGMDPIASLTSATAAVWTGYAYAVLGRALGGDGVLPTPRDVVAYGRPGRWEVAYLPFSDGLTFTHLAAAIRPTTGLPDRLGRPLRAVPGNASSPYELLAVGTYPDGSAFSMVGYQADGGPRFTGVPLPIPEITNPVSVEWTGHDYVVVGDRGNGQFGVMVGAPGRWSRADDFHLDGGKFTSITVAPRATRPSDASGYDLLAVGGLDGAAVELPGWEVSGMPVFEHHCVAIPQLLALGGGTGGSAAGLRVAGADALSVPYPNPSAGAASFSVALAREQAVRVDVLDALGRPVAVLHDGPLATGTHAFTFGGALPAGTYFVRAQGEGFVQTRPVVLVR